MGTGTIVVLLVIGLVLLIYVVEYNSIKSLKNKVNQSKSGIDVVLTNRFELIPNLVECVKGYCAHEEKTLQEVVKARTDYLSSKSLEDGEIADNKTNSILLLAEQYPELKASSQFLDLQSALQKTEGSLAAARRLYNSDVTMYNTKISTFPGNIFAGLMGAKEEKLFEADEAAKASVKVEF